MQVYDHPTFRSACEQFDAVADRMQIPENQRERLKYPKRSMTVALPIIRDNGRTEVFAGYRVQHHLTLGPTKGGLRYHPDVTLGEVAALAMWMSWKCALAAPLRGAGSGCIRNPRAIGRSGCTPAEPYPPNRKTNLKKKTKNGNIPLTNHIPVIRG